VGSQFVLQKPNHFLETTQDHSEKTDRTFSSKKRKMAKSSITTATMMSKATAEPELVASFATLPGIKQTTSGSFVVSVVVEIVSCSDLPASPLLKVALADPYVKVKLAKPSNKRQHAMEDIHKTKSLEKT
jgi:hypothetical protein